MSKTPAQKKKAVVIAKDVIAQIRAKRYEATQGAYCVFNNITNENALKSPYDDSEDIDVQNMLKIAVTKANPCQVCAIGSLFMSKVAKYNDCIVSELIDLDDRDIAVEHLSNAFTDEELNWMERYFEWNRSDWDDGETYKTSWVNLKPDTRLISMCNNVIKNKGVFNNKEFMDKHGKIDKETGENMIELYYDGCD